jgi:hypothetical protein
MATSRSNLPKEMMPLSSTPPKKKKGGFGELKADPFGAAPVAPKGNPFAKKQPKGFAEGGEITVGSGKEATPGALPKAGRKVKPTGGGTMRGAGAATKGKHFQGTF